MIQKLRPVWLYVGAVIAGGGIIGFSFVAGADAAIRSDYAEFWLLTTLVTLGELFPVTAKQLDGGEGEIVTSTIFTLAILLHFGVGPAIVAQSFATYVSDLRMGKPLWKASFNVAQFALAITAAGAVLGALTSASDFHGIPVLEAGDLPGILAAAGVLFVTNNGLCRIAIGLHQEAPLLRFVLSDLGYHAWVNCVLLTLSPLVVIVGEQSLVYIPLLAVPMTILYLVAKLYAERDYKAYLAMRDPLTGLPNRALFSERLERALLDADRRGTSVAVLLIDLDRFKEVNDCLGHHVGDVLLQKIGPRVQAVLREVDTFARFGGDEFMILLPSVGGADEAITIADRVLNALELPFVLDEVSQGVTLDVEASIGIALYPDHGSAVEVLIQKADVAMYLAKDGRTGRELYADERDRHSARELSLLGELRHAIDERQLHLHYQPKVHLPSGRVTGVEALLRWHHPTRGVIPPDEFVVATEQTGLVRMLTLYVLEAAIDQWEAWRARGVDLTMAVNLSRRNLLDARFADDVAKVLQRHDVPAGYLDFEITESSILADPVRAAEVCTILQEMGIGLSLDDFGAGYSSLGFLKRLPVREIKIDKSFVMAMTHDENDEVIVRSTIDLARNLGLKVVAEGIEQEEVRTRLTDLGCEYGQGYLFSTALSGSDLPRWLNQFQRKHEVLEHVG